MLSCHQSCYSLSFSSSSELLLLIILIVIIITTPHHSHSHYHPHTHLPAPSSSLYLQVQMLQCACNCFFARARATAPWTPVAGKQHRQVRNPPPTRCWRRQGSLRTRVWCDYIQTNGHWQFALRMLWALGVASASLGEEIYAAKNAWTNLNGEPS